MKIMTKVVLLAVCGVFLLAGCSTKPHAHSWEYRTLTTDNRKGKSVLDNYGKSGWELVGYTCIVKGQSGTNFEYQYVFKRPKK